MAKCILHIGMNKTGSTSIQSSLAALDDEAFYYARVLKSPNHSLSVFNIFAESPERHPKNQKKIQAAGDLADIVRQARRDLRASMERAAGRTLIISGEGLGALEKAGIVKLQRFLERHSYGDVEVVAYIRPPAAYLSSSMQQRIKGGNMPSFQPYTCKPDYRKSFAKFESCFGASALRFIKFDKQSLHRQDVVFDFCRRLGISEASVSPVRRNESITKLATQLIYQYTRFHEAEGLPALKSRDGDRLGKMVESLDPQRFRLSPLVVTPILRQIADDIAWMEGRLGQPLDEELGDELETDIRSERDLLDPIPGINDKLAKLLGESGTAASLNTCRLIHLLAAQAARPGARRAQRGERQEAISWQREDAIQ